MQTNVNGLTAFPIESNVISSELEEIVEQPLVSDRKSDFKTEGEEQQRLVILAEDTRRRLKRSAMDIYCIGLNLLEAQNIIEHGEFLSWLRQEFGMGKTSAYEFINVAKAFESKFPIIGNLINNITPTALCKLGSPSTPVAAIDEAIELVKAGEVVDPDVAKNLINKYKPPKVAVRKQQQASSTSQNSNTNQVEALVDPNTEIVETERKNSKFTSFSSIPEQDQLQRLVAEINAYKTQLEQLQMVNRQLLLDIAKLRSELKLSQNINHNGL